MMAMAVMSPYLGGLLLLLLRILLDRRVVLLRGLQVSRLEVLAELRQGLLQGTCRLAGSSLAGVRQILR